MRPRRPRRRTEDLFAWLELVLTDGPFLSRPALKAQFPAGLARPDDAVDDVREAFRSGFGDWEKAWTEWMRAEDRTDVETSSRYLGQRDAWVQTFVTDVLEWGEYYRTDLDAAVTATNLDASVTVQSSGALDAGGARAALVLVIEPTEDLTAPGADGWTASSIDRGAALLRASGENGGTRAPVAIVTDGRWWSLVWQNAQGGTGSGIFDGALFREEPDLRDAFWALARLTSLAGGARDRRLDALLEASMASAEEITDALGNQVRASVELLVQSFSASHLHALADGSASPLPANAHEVYDAAVTSMMRTVFLLFAEANELLPTQQLYREAYGISDVLDRLDERRRHAVGVEGDEALGSTFDTWHRLLATSRALYEGATFEDLRMPAYGGSLFDPDRFPWLTSVNEVSGGLQVLVDDRVMFHVLRSVQHVDVNGEDRQVSFRELDVEQIGYVYEGLLGYSARYTDEVVVGLQGPENGSEPEVALETLHELNDLAEEDQDDFAERLVAWVKEHQPAAKSRTVRQLAKAYAESGDIAVQDEARRRLRPVVGDGALVEELIGYYKLMRLDPRGLPYVVPAGGLVVVETRSRATSGTHYTPRSLAEEVVHHALEPLVYSPGPLQTAKTTEWVPISASQLLDLKVADIAVGSGAFLVAAARYLADRLLEAWDREGITREDSTADQRHHRRVESIREVIAHCLYGADINPMAVEMCKLSLWLVSLDPDRPFSFVDDKILCGNSLLGLSELRQLRGLHIDPSAARLRDPGFTVDVDSAIRRATDVRHQLSTPVSEADSMRSTRAKRALLAQLTENNQVLRAIGDGIIAAGLSIGGKPGRQLDAKYEALALSLMDAFPDAGVGDRRGLDEILDDGLSPSVSSDFERWEPLHWVIEFPDVMIDHGGFDAVIGNPPFLGGKKISPAMGQNIRLWLVNQLASGTAGNADLVAYFFLRASALLARDRGQLGLIATNTIAQGDTREVALDRLVSEGLVVRRAVRSASWPARGANLEYAAVWASLAAVAPEVPRVADGVPVPMISSLLEPEGRVSGPPAPLVENRRIAFQGSIVLGSGFLLRQEEAQRLLDRSPQNSEVLFPYLNGEDLNSRPDSSASRWVINFKELSLDAAASFEEPWQVIETLVKPDRMAKDAARYPRMVHEWWKYWNARPGMYEAIQGLETVLVIALTSRSLMPLRVPNGQVFSHALVVFATDDYVDQAVLSSSLHQAWAMMYGSAMRNDSRYTPSSVFVTFPRPAPNDILRAIGRILDEERREMMLRRRLGLTKLYNLVNDPDRSGDRDVDRLRDIHAELDRAVLRSYGWEDVALEHGFYTYRQSDRFTISPVARVEVLDRLLEENHRRSVMQSGAKGTDEADELDIVEEA